MSVAVFDCEVDYKSREDVKHTSGSVAFARQKSVYLEQQPMWAGAQIICRAFDIKYPPIAN